MICCLLFKELPGWHVNTEEWGIASCIGLRAVKPEIFAVGWWFSTDRDILQATHVASCRIKSGLRSMPFTVEIKAVRFLRTHVCHSANAVALYSLPHGVLALSIITACFSFGGRPQVLSAGLESSLKSILKDGIQMNCRLDPVLLSPRPTRS